MKAEKEIRAHIEVETVDGFTDWLSFPSAQKALIGALTLATSKSVNLSELTVYSGNKPIFHKAF